LYTLPNELRSEACAETGRRGLSARARAGWTASPLAEHFEELHLLLADSALELHRARRRHALARIDGQL